MATRTWARPVGEGETAQVSVESTDGIRATSYRIAFPFMVGDQSADDIQVTGTGKIDDHRIRSEGGLPVSDLTISITEECAVERLVIRSREDRIVIHLPSRSLFERCERAIDGDEAAVSALIDTFASPVQIPLICGSFLGLADTVGLIQALVRDDHYVRSMLHSYRIAIVRAALVSRSGLTVGTFRELKELVDGLDAIEEIGGLSVVEVLGDVIATVHDSLAETETMLDELGVDFEQVDEASDGLLTAGLLAHIACTDGVEAAEQYEIPRKLPPRGNYDRRKRAVFQAEYGERGAAWRRLLNAARRESPHEIGYVLAYTLYWTGEESRTDSRLQELLLRGAELAADHKRLRKIASRARFHRLLAAGHRLRGTHCWVPAVANFAAAIELAQEEPFLDEWEPVLAKGLVHSRQLSKQGDHGAAVEELDRTIESLLLADPPVSVANRSIRHLKAQKSEIDAQRYRSEAPAIAQHLLEEARDHYAALGFDRSRDKVDRMLESLPGRAATEASTAEGTPSTAEEAEAQPPLTEASPGSTAESGGTSGVVLDDVDADDEDWLEAIEYPDEDGPPPEYDEKFEDPYAF